MAIIDLRKDYTQSSLRAKDLDPNPLLQFQKWLQEAIDAQQPEPNAMTLSTADRDGRPSARTVLLRGVDEHGFSFFTNYESQKGRELNQNPRAALTFHWAKLERQVCISGDVAKLSNKESETYFKSRPIESQLGAWASKQSTVVANREMLEESLKKVTEQFSGKEIPMPPHWGGFLVVPRTIEFWQGRPARLHDRFRYTNHFDYNWKIERLSP